MVKRFSKDWKPPDSDLPLTDPYMKWIEGAVIVRGGKVVEAEEEKFIQLIWLAADTPSANRLSQSGKDNFFFLHNWNSAKEYVVAPGERQ